MPRPCQAHVLAFLLNMVDGVILDETPIPCTDPAGWVTTVERGVGSYAATCEAHDLMLRLDPGHVRSARLPTT